MGFAMGIAIVIPTGITAAEPTTMEIHMGIPMGIPIGILHGNSHGNSPIGIPM